MSEESANSPEKSEKVPTKTASRVRRISNPRPKKAAKSAKSKAAAENDDASVPVAEVPTPVESAPAAPVAEESKSDSGASSNDWPDFSSSDGQAAPERGAQEGNAAEGSSGSSPDGPKRKRRRKKGKGNGAQSSSAAGDGEGPSEAPENRGDSAPVPAAARPNQGPRPKLDSELLAKFAWKIFLAEVSEEGVALVGDNDARELGRRCFRLAEIFLEEQARRR